MSTLNCTRQMLTELICALLSNTSIVNIQLVHQVNMFGLRGQTHPVPSAIESGLQASEQTLFGVPPELLLLFHVRKDSIRNGTDRTNWTQTNIHYAIRSECVHSIDQVVIGNMIRVSSFPVAALIIHQSTLNFLQSIALARPVATELVSG